MQGCFMLQQVVYGGYPQLGCKRFHTLSGPAFFYGGVNLEMTIVKTFRADL
jgi:hypothetical protein